jgi:hypothetical protein
LKERIGRKMVNFVIKLLSANGECLGAKRR